MRRSDRTRCPHCGERVSAFAAGCAICGADLDIHRFDKPQRWRLSQHPWLTPAAIVVVVVLFGYLVSSGPDQPSPDALASRPAPLVAPTPSDAKRVVETVVGGAPPISQRSALKRYLAARGIPASAVAAIMRHSRDGVGLVASKSPTGTRVGGAGLVPAGQGWPRSAAGYPLDFIAVVDFAQLPHLDPLPRRGRLALYYAGNPDDPQFADPVAAARAFYFPPGAPTASPKAPTDTYPIAPTYLRGKLMSFSGDSEQVVEDTSGDAQDELIDAMNDVTTEALQPSHLLGTSFAVQGPPLDELASHLGGTSGQVSPASASKYSKAERRDPRRWVLLAEIQEEGELTIADGGVLYYAIPRRDLAAGRFDRVAVIMQSH